MSGFIKGLIVFTLSNFLTVIIFFLSILVPVTIMMQMGNSNPPPPFDVAPNQIYFSDFSIQWIYILGILLTPVLGSYIAYLLNSKKKNALTFSPAIIFYSGYIIFVLLYLFTDIFIVRYY